MYEPKFDIHNEWDKKTNKYCTVFQPELYTLNSTTVFIEVTDKEVYSVTLIGAKLFVIDLSDV